MEKTTKLPTSHLCAELVVTATLMPKCCLKSDPSLLLGSRQSMWVKFVHKSRLIRKQCLGCLFMEFQSALSGYDFYVRTLDIVHVPGWTESLVATVAVSLLGSHLIEI